MSADTGSPDTGSIAAFAQKLVQTPSQGGIDSPESIVNIAYDFGKSLGLPVVKLNDGSGQPVAVVAKIEGAHPGKTWAVNATLDTAPAGDRSQWDGDPFSGEIRDGQLHGRGAGDSKIAASLFLHLARELNAQKEHMRGSFLLILDADEHTGNFGGIKAALQAGCRPDGVMIGYPGDDKIVVGSRGFARYEIALSGKGAHSGASAPAEDNALVRLAEIVQELSAIQPQADDPDFPRQPKVTVTEVAGGDGYSVVPSSARVKVDVRLTPLFNEAAADRHVRRIVQASDLRHRIAAERKTAVVKVSSEPAYLTPDTSELRRALREAAQEITGSPVKETVSGPSNIGNFLAKQGIEVTAGYGVPAKGAHAANEKASLKPLASVYAVYRRAFGKLLKA